MLEYHIHLGQYKERIPNDAIERTVIDLQKKLQIGTDISARELVNKLHELEKDDGFLVSSCKEEILRYVPTRLLSPFLDATETDFQREERIFKKIFEANEKAALPYDVEEFISSRNRAVKSLGNMTLLTSKLNTSVSNSNFEVKINGKTTGSNPSGIKRFASSLVAAKSFLVSGNPCM